MRRFLVWTHAVLAGAGLVGAVLAGKDGAMACLALALLLAWVTWAVARRSRWAAAPGCLLIAGLVLMIALTTVGNIAWRESDIAKVALPLLAVLVLEIVALVWVYSAPGSP
jgi:hypothetical protein